MNKKGQASLIWLSALVILFVIGLVYVAFSKPHQQISDTFESELSGDYLTTFNRIKSAWFVWPIVMTVSVILWMLIRSLQGQSEAPPPYG